jgi:GntR family transcriptional regulator
MPNPLIRESNGAPLYARLQAILRDEIERTLAPGDALPTEPELEARFGVSRITVRRAMDELRAAGVVVREQGRGTFVALPRIRQDSTLLMSWSASLARLGHETRTAETEIETVLLDSDRALPLDCAPGTETVRITRLKVSSAGPICLMTNFVAPRLTPLFRNGLREDSIYATLAAQGIAPVAADDRIEARAATAAEAERLGISTDAPLLQITRVAYDRDRQPLYVAVVANRADRVSYAMSVGEPR